jgi:hypothetical protein
MRFLIGLAFLAIAASAQYAHLPFLSAPSAVSQHAAPAAQPASTVLHSGLVGVGSAVSLDVSHIGPIGAPAAGASDGQGSASRDGVAGWVTLTLPDPRSAAAIIPAATELAPGDAPRSTERKRAPPLTVA